MLTACTENTGLVDLENRIRQEVLSECTAIASLQSVYLLTLVHTQENWVFSDDIYIRKDKAEVDYGFQIDRNAIRVVNEGGRNILRVQLMPVDRPFINRVKIEENKTHENFQPKTMGDIDASMNRELDDLESAYKVQNMQLAMKNIKNFFNIVAAKYGLEADVSIRSISQ